MKPSWKAVAITTWLLLFVITVSAIIVCSSPKLLFGAVNTLPPLPYGARKYVLLRLFDVSRQKGDEELKLFICERNFALALDHLDDVEKRLNELASTSSSRKLLVLQAMCRMAAQDNQKASALLRAARAIPLENQENMVGGSGITDDEIEARLRRIERGEP